MNENLIRICKECNNLIYYKNIESYKHSCKKYSDVSCISCNRRRTSPWKNKKGKDIPWYGSKLSEHTKELLRNKIPVNKYSIKDFILKAKRIHNEKYDYSKSNYINSHIKIEIICPKHGSFWQIPTSHLFGIGCSKCGRDILHLKFKLTTNEFKEKANKIHDNKYDYSKSSYINNHTKLIIICPIHGEFSQIPVGHLSGQGCSKCNGGVKYTLHKFIKLSNKIHKNKYEYDNVVYINGRNQIKIKCKIHGYFIQFPSDHLQGHGCPKCVYQISKPENEFLNCYNIKIRNYRLPEWKRKSVDGYDPQTNTIYEFLGDYWHGNPEKYEHSQIHPEIKKSYGELYHITFLKLKKVRDLGYNIIYIWESDWNKFKNEINKSSNIQIYVKYF